jgi:hypothetical protein
MEEMERQRNYDQAEEMGNQIGGWPGGGVIETIYDPS